MNVEFTVSAPSLEEVREKIANKLEIISQAKPEGEYLVDLDISFSDKHYFSYSDEAYEDDFVVAKEKRKQEGKDVDETKEETREEFMQRCENGIMNELKTKEFKIKYTAVVNATFSCDNTWC